ncbi:MAG: hypothetical protein OXG33_11150 [Chloroflexi bacterium]|nr:hypothetical protein [Chloroflexota bacterium]
MVALMPWARLEARIRSVDLTGECGRPRSSLALLTQIHCVQLFSNLGDLVKKDGLYGSVAVQRLVRLTAWDLRPDETMILHFRYLLELNAFGEDLLAENNRHLATRGLRLREGTILDAPASTKNRAQARDPEMHQVKKGK